MERKLAGPDPERLSGSEGLEESPNEAVARTGRLALVIGNSKYQNAARLINPVNDMKGMGAALSRLGFEVMTAEDLSKRDLEHQLGLFYRKAKAVAAILLFYAGHAIQINGRNFLIPVDAQIREETDLLVATIDLGQIIDTVASICPNTLVFLDACRNNPFEETLQRSMGARSVYLGRGLAEMKQGGVDTFISYATAPGQTASDGNQANSPYTRAMLAHIEEPNLELAQFARRILNDVRTTTKLKQVPWYHSSFGHEFHFKHFARDEPANGNDRLRQLIETKDPYRLRVFIDHNPGGQVEVDAKIALAKLEKEAFERIAKTNKADILQRYITDFPQGDYTYSN